MVTTGNLTKTYPVLDADSHVLEPAALWAQYLDPEYRVVAPLMVLARGG